jgi:tRNA(Ile)-lysidine synthase TilS/MesJ
VIALGHHADDLAETTLLNLLFHGKVETMAPTGDYFEGTFRLIRPLCYTPKAEIQRFAKVCDFPPPPPECPRSDHTSRKLIADLIAQAETQHPDVRVNLLSAGLKGNYSE